MGKPGKQMAKRNALIRSYKRQLSTDSVEKVAPLCLLCSHEDLVMDDTRRSTVPRFLFVYKVLFSSLLVASIGVAVQLAFTSQLVEAGRTLRSASVTSLRPLPTGSVSPKFPFCARNILTVTADSPWTFLIPPSQPVILAWYRLRTWGYCFRSCVKSGRVA